tara:strand:- start:777 stop:914 length:138 start_codon:yes stop_codon:yes gene_type:complete
MTREEKLLKIKSLQEMIIQLKSNPSVESKKTIQSLQQQIDNISRL